MSSYWSSPLKINNNQIGPVDNRHRIYVTDLGPDCTEELIAKAFSKWPIIEIWHAKASCFAFIVLQNRVDVEQAIDELDGQRIGNARVRVSLARPRNRSINHGRNANSFNRRCYQCGRRGHLSYECENQQKDDQHDETKKLSSHVHNGRVTRTYRRQWTRL